MLVVSRAVLVPVFPKVSSLTSLPAILAVVVPEAASKIKLAILSVGQCGKSVIFWEHSCGILGEPKL